MLRIATRRGTIYLWLERQLSPSGRLCVRGRRQRNGGLAREQQESESLLQIQADNSIGVAEVTDGEVLADVKVEIASTGGQHESTGNSGRPDDLIVDKALDMLQHRVPVVADLGECGVGVGAEQHRVGAVDTDETQPAQALGNGFRVLAHVGGERHDRIAGPLTDASNAGGSVALEYGVILGKGDQSRSVLRRLPVRVVRATINVVDRLAIQLERNTQLDQRLHLALPCDDAVPRSRDRLQVASADGGEAGAAWPMYVDDASSGQVALEGARCFLFDLSPRRIGNGGKLAM